MKSLTACEATGRLCVQRARGGPSSHEQEVESVAVVFETCRTWIEREGSFFVRFFRVAPLCGLIVENQADSKNGDGGDHMTDPAAITLIASALPAAVTFFFQRVERLIGSRGAEPEANVSFPEGLAGSPACRCNPMVSVSETAAESSNCSGPLCPTTHRVRFQPVRATSNSCRPWTGRGRPWKTSTVSI